MWSSAIIATIISLCHIIRNFIQTQNKIWATLMLVTRLGFLGCCHQNELSPTSITSIDVALNQTPVWSSETLNKIKKSSPNIFEAKSTTFDSKNKLCYSDLWFDCGIILPISSCNLIFCCCSGYRRSICYLFFLELTLCYGFLKFSESYIWNCKFSWAWNWKPLQIIWVAKERF